MKLEEFFDKIVKGKITRAALASLLVQEGAGCGEILHAVMGNSIQERDECETPPSVNFRGQALYGITRHFLAVENKDLEMAREVAQKNPDLGWKTRAWLFIYGATRERADLEKANMAEKLLKAQCSNPYIECGLRSLRCRILEPARHPACCLAPNAPDGIFLSFQERFYTYCMWIKRLDFKRILR